MTRLAQLLGLWFALAMAFGLGMVAAAVLDGEGQ